MTITETDEQWQSDWSGWHASREKAVLAPHGIAANTGTTWLSDEPEAIADLPGTWVIRDGRAYNQQLDLELAPGEDRLLGEQLVKVIAPRPGTLAVRVFDPNASTRTGLTGISAFAPDPGWVLTGDFEPAEVGSTIAITHFDGVTTDDRLSGTVHLEVAGQHVHLSAWAAPEAGILELTFTDTTNGVSTKQFRFLKFAAPDSGGAVVLDFNRAFLPPCALGAGYLCPIPPAQNRLPFAVEAGERFPQR